MAAPIIVLMGPPASGKGTQAERLSAALDAIHISSGEVLRHSRDPKIQRYLLAGKLAPTAEVERLVAGAVSNVPSHHPIVLDGVTRTLEEAQWLEGLRAKGRAIRKVILLKLSRQEAERRSRGRERSDDRASVFDRRWDEYEREIQPVSDYYRKLGLLAEVSGEGTPDEVEARIKQALDGNTA